MASYQQQIQNTNDAFSSDYAAIERPFYQRRIEAEAKLLGHLYAAGGDIRHLVSLAKAQGISSASWLDPLGEHATLWKIATEASSTSEAREAARQVARAGKIFVTSLDELFDRVFCYEVFTVADSILLMQEIAAEREARLIRARYVALMTGTVKANVPTTRQIARAA